MLKKLLNTKGFALIFFLKVIILCIFASDYDVNYFIPFLNHFVSSGFSDPYFFFTENGVNNIFPYPSGMLYILSIPRLIISPFISNGLNIGFLNIIALKIPILVADIVVFQYLIKIFKAHQKKITWLYWASPILIYASYIHGQLDLIPIAFCFTAVYYISYQNKMWLSCMLFSIGLICKWHIIIILPFIIIYLFRNKVDIKKILLYMFLPITLFILSVIPFHTSSFINMVLFTEQQSKFFSASFHFGEQLIIYLTPAFIFFVLLKFFTYKKLNREIFFLFCGIVFGVTVAFAPASPAWYIWPFPFMIYFFTKEKSFSNFYMYILGGLYLLYFLINDYSPILRTFYLFDSSLKEAPGLLSYFGLTESVKTVINNLFFTCIQTVILAIIFFMYRIGIKSNEYYKIKYSPTMIGISGDSGTGKHTLAEDLKSLVGRNNNIQINGDDYHKWERGNKNYDSFTHLNPISNKLNQQSEDAYLLKENNSIFKVEYDHSTGKFTNPKKVDPNQFVIFVGLHSFYHKKMRNVLDLKIFLAPNESLRRHWKIIRDMKKRSYTKKKVIESIEARLADFDKAIFPQKAYADLVLEYFPLKEIKDLGNAEEEVLIGVQYHLDNDLSDIEQLYFELNSVDEIKVELDYAENEKQVFSFSGKISSEKLSEIAHKLIPNMEELTKSSILWMDDLRGMNQLIFLILLKNKMTLKNTL